MTGHEKTQGPKHKRDLTRRKVIAAGTGAVVAAGVGGTFAAGAFAGEETPAAGAKTAATSGETCYKLTSETTEGPYYIDADKLRRDVTEDQDGIPLTLRLKVIDADTCKPLANAAVDIWHCNALGVYSGYEAMGSGGGGGGGGGTPASGSPTGSPTGAPPGGGGGGGGHEEPTDDERYLRGTWRTDKKGEVVFRTVFPGWYQGRCVHIHTKVHVNGTWTDAGYEGGTTCHTGQLFFDEASVLATAEVEPYSTNTTTRTTLDEDTIYPGNGTEGGLLKLKYKKGAIAKGVVATLTMGVDPEATQDGTSAG
ncbi:intradiol ring-cleavage dioxygenase [Streptomyces collinus]|uniref:Protocatechuate 3,4-dioxygenase beta subunit n=1 Tax=Streptomyces collinus TaxID=42684 RepID=A0AA89QAD6_STRCU|nr:intradiol ring-cleavage dioxygenase [Streptomyces collinus]MBB5812465.1 protocatechuate 3,4-dioxygenase beta subunit [Streptomyces collinus]WMX65617.1 intradiol ring-cleavage dioxygenase [Streptomyces collinus]